MTNATWCRNLFATLHEGGKWGIPRSGLIFTKRGGRLELTDVMPHDPAMPITEAELVEQQKNEFDLNKRHFGEAGIEVVDRTAGAAT